MTNSPLKKFVLTPLVISGAVFAALASPLSVIGSNTVTIYFQKEPLFQGKLREISTPYLLLAAALSGGAGIASIAINGWKISSTKSSQAQAQVLELVQNLKEKEAQLEALQISETRIEEAGLSDYVNLGTLQSESVSEKPLPVHQEVTPQEELKPPTIPPEVPTRIEPLIITTQPAEALPITPYQITVQVAAYQFSCVHTFVGYSQMKATLKKSQITTASESRDVEILHTQLQQMMNQISSLQSTLSTHTNTVTPKTQVYSPIHGGGGANWRLLQVIK
ncbi:MAG TPA: hypothetical protein V6C95_20395 [Coleofasciculaceae cyanobacterium]